MERETPQNLRQDTEHIIDAIKSSVDICREKIIHGSFRDNEELVSGFRDELSAVCVTLDKLRWQVEKVDMFVRLKRHEEHRPKDLDWEGLWNLEV